MAFPSSPRACDHVCARRLAQERNGSHAVSHLLILSNSDFAWCCGRDLLAGELCGCRSATTARHCHARTYEGLRDGLAIRDLSVMAAGCLCWRVRRAWYGAHGAGMRMWHSLMRFHASGSWRGCGNGVVLIMSTAGNEIARTPDGAGEGGERGTRSELGLSGLRQMSSPTCM
jgi:hypothetical protein